MSHSLTERVDQLIARAARDARIREGLLVSVACRVRLDGIHSLAVIDAMECGLAKYETIAFPDEPGSPPSSEKLRSRKVLCFDPDAFAVLRERL